MILLTLDGDKLLVRAPFALKDTCRSLPGARWNSKAKAWTYPADPTTATQVHAAFTSCSMPVRYRDTETEQFFADADAEVARRRQAMRVTADDLPPLIHATTTPWPHQRRGVHLIHHQPATLLMWEMGSGKTLAVVNAVGEGDDSTRTLVLCPRAVIPVWPREFAKHTGRPVDVVAPVGGNMSVAKRQAAIAARLALPGPVPRVAVLNYEAAWRDPMADWLLAQEWDMLVCDEIHRLKSPGGRASKYVARLAKGIPTRVGLTGTFLPHSPLDAYAQYRVLDPAIFGTSFVAFKRRYAVLGGYQVNGRAVQVIGWQNEPDLHRKIYSIADRVLTEDVLQLPDFTSTVVPVELDSKTMGVYRELAKDFVAGVADGLITADNALVKLLRLRQLTSGIAIVEDADDPSVTKEMIVNTSKRDALADRLADLDPREPVAIFYAFKPDAEAIREACKKVKRPCFEISGRIDQLADWQRGGCPCGRDDAAERMAAMAPGYTVTPKCPDCDEYTGSVLAAQIQSANEGVDFTRARYQWYYSQGVNRGHYDQSLRRIRRPGQARHVHYAHFVATGTYDQQIYRAFDKGRDVTEALLSMDILNANPNTEVEGDQLMNYLCGQG